MVFITDSNRPPTALATPPSRGTRELAPHRRTCGCPDVGLASQTARAMQKATGGQRHPFPPCEPATTPIRCLPRERVTTPIRCLPRERATTPIRCIPRERATTPIRCLPRERATTPIPCLPRERATTPIRCLPRERATTPIRCLPRERATTPLQRPPPQGVTKGQFQQSALTATATIVVTASSSV